MRHVLHCSGQPLGVFESHSDAVDAGERVRRAFDALGVSHAFSDRPYLRPDDGSMGMYMWVQGTPHTLSDHELLAKHGMLRLGIRTVDRFPANQSELALMAWAFREGLDFACDYVDNEHASEHERCDNDCPFPYAACAYEGDWRSGDSQYVWIDRDGVIRSRLGPVTNISTLKRVHLESL